MGAPSRIRRALALAVVLLAGVARADEAADGDLAAARSLLDGGRYDDARKAFERLAGRRGPGCGECLLGLAEAQLQLGKAKDAIKACDRALGADLADAKLRARAHNLKALALLREGRGADEALRRAEEQLTLALEATPDEADMRYNRGHVRLRLRRDTEGIADLERFLALHPAGPAAERARRLIADPRRARERFVPDFSLVTLQGETLDPRRLEGRVVIIDFWATWCAPCRDAIPEIKDLLRKYPGQRLMVLSISADENEKAWRDFVARNQMTWPQYFDRDGRVRGLFGVNVFPTYLVVDGDGIVRGEVQGTDPRYSIAHRLRKTLAAFPQLSER